MVKTINSYAKVVVVGKNEKPWDYIIDLTSESDNLKYFD